ncbi:MAG: ABC transporter permease [Anaerovorax sp.]
MNSRDLFGLSIRNLLRRKTRTLLAVMGVIVGTCAIVVMLSIGFGLSVSYQEQIENSGNLHLIDVYQGGGGMAMSTGNGAMGNSPSASGTPGVLNDKAITAIEKIPGVDAASPKEELYVSLVIGKYVAQSTTLLGISPQVMQKFKYELKDGRLLQPGDKFAMVFGNQVPTYFFNPKKSQGFNWNGEAQVDVVTDKIMITGDEMYGQKPQQGMGGETEKINYKEYKGKGVGVLANANDDSAYKVFMPLETVKAMKAEKAKARKEPVKRNGGYESAMVYVGDIKDVEPVSQAIREMGFQPNSLNDWLKSTQDTARMIQGILGGIGAISLLVAALGITNTMIMSIYKRMFLVEAAFIGLIGGLMGLALSYLLSLLMNTVLSGVLSTMLGGIGGGGGSTISIIPWWVAVGSVTFATVIGVVSGYYPANRAMKLSALESLRNE